VLSKLTDSKLKLPQRKLTKNDFYKEINTFADVVFAIGTRFVAELAVVDTNAPVRLVGFTVIPVTIRGGSAVQPVGDIVPRFSF